MRHRVIKHSFGRKPGSRKALVRGLVDSLVEHGRIRTTLPKAKELRRHVERAVTLGKEGTVHARRVLLSRYPNKKTVNTLVDDISKRFKNREGGYTRIRKLGPRPGDSADMALIEFVDYVLPEMKDETTVTGDKNEKARQRRQAKVAVKAKKSRRKLQAKSRNINR